MSRSPFITAPHPKTELSPTRAAIQKVLQAGWWGQMKVHGHRLQIHISTDETAPVFAYTRQGQPHKVPVPLIFIAELRRLLALTEGYSAVDAEWLKGSERLFLFDYLKRNDQLLSTKSYPQRYELLPRVYRSTCIETLPVLKTVDDCMAVLEREEDWVEGLVFKSTTTIGFRDSAVVRCRRTTQA